jgi:hypothetical protein
MIAVKNDENDVSWFYVEDEDNGHNRWNKLSPKNYILQKQIRKN